MQESIESLLLERGYDVHGRTRGASGTCWVVASKRATWDYGEQQSRSFIAVADDNQSDVDLYYRFSVSRSALACDRVKRLTGDAEHFLLEAGLIRFRRLIQADDSVKEEYQEEILNSHSGDDEFVMVDARDLDAEIKRVEESILGILRDNAYRGLGRTSKENIRRSVCTADNILDRTIGVLGHRRFVDGALSGQMKITPEGEAQLDTLRVNSRPKETVTQVIAPPLVPNTYDVFISHASEDKDAFVRPLVSALIKSGLKVWYDEFTLKLGDSLRASIDKGLATSRFGVVILSHRFFAKDWPQKELNGIFALMQSGEKKLLPIWHEITREELAKYSPMVADLLAARSDEGVDEVVLKILEVVKQN